MAGAWLAESVQQAMLDPKVVSLSPALDVEFTLKKKNQVWWFHNQQTQKNHHRHGCEKNDYRFNLH